MSVFAKVSQLNKKAEELKKRIRRAAITNSGYSFAVLELLEPTKSRISGIDVVLGKKGERVGKYSFFMAQKQLVFEKDEKYDDAMIAFVALTERNKKFLAGHLNVGYWEIIETRGPVGTPSVEGLIEELAKINSEYTKNKKTGYKPSPRLLPATGIDLASLEDDNLEEQISLMKKEAERRKQIAKKQDAEKTQVATQKRKAKKTPGVITQKKKKPEEKKTDLPAFEPEIKPESDLLLNDNE